MKNNDIALENVSSDPIVKFTRMFARMTRDMLILKRVKSTFDICFPEYPLPNNEIIPGHLTLKCILIHENKYLYIK